MQAQRIASSDRMNRDILTGAALAFIVLLALYVWLFGRQSQPADTVGDWRCRQRYGEAKTAADSAIIDTWRPVIGRVNAAGSLTCSQLRRLGRTK